MKREKESKAKKILAKVSRVLDRFVDPDTVKEVCLMSISCQRSLFVRLPNGKWTSNININDANGYIGEYSFNIIDILGALENLGFFTNKETEVFYDWYNSKRNQHTKESEIERMKEIARKYNYEVKPHTLP